MEDAPSVTLLHAFDVRQAVAHAGCQDHAPGGELRPVWQGEQESVIDRVGVDRHSGSNLDRGVPSELLATDPPELVGRHPVSCQETVSRMRLRVPWLVAVHNDDATAGAPQQKPRAQSGRSTTNNDDIELIHTHLPYRRYLVSMRYTVPHPRRRRGGLV